MARQGNPHGKSGFHRADAWSAHAPLPEAREGGESAWEQWQEASRRLDLAFAPTEPSSVGALSGVGGIAEDVATETRSHLLTVHNLMVVARRNNRVCPAPSHWADLYQMLDGEHQADLAAPPVQPWLWPKLSGLQKRLRFREHVEWAERHGRLEQVARFMGGLKEEEWVHMGED